MKKIKLHMKKHDFKPEYVFYSDRYAEKMDRDFEEFAEKISGILSAYGNIQITYSNVRKLPTRSAVLAGLAKYRCKYIVYTIGNEIRYTYFVDGVPTYHHENFNEFVKDIYNIILENDIDIRIMTA